jgi:hypothetical protein
LTLKARKKKTLSVAMLNYPKPVQVCQDRCINGLDQEKPVIPTQKAYWTRAMSCGQPLRDYSNMKWQVLVQAKIKCIIMPVQTFLSIRDYSNMKLQVLLQAKIKCTIMPVQTFLPLGTTQT